MAYATIYAFDSHIKMSYVLGLDLQNEIGLNGLSIEPLWISL